MIFTFVTKRGKDGQPVLPNIAKQFLQSNQYFKDMREIGDRVEIDFDIPNEVFEQIRDKLFEKPENIEDIVPPNPAPVSTGKTAISTGSTT
jgi:hypothetical protein